MKVDGSDGMGIWCSFWRFELRFLLYLLSILFMLLLLSWWYYYYCDGDCDVYHYLPPPHHHHHDHYHHFTIILIDIVIVIIYIYFFTIKPKMKQMDVSKWNKKSYSIIQPVSNKDFTSTNSKPPTQTKERKPYLIYMSLSWITSTRYLGITAVKRWRDISSEIRGRRDARWRVIGGNGRTFGGNGVPLGKSFWFVNGVCVLLSFSFLFGVYVFFSKRR